MPAAAGVYRVVVLTADRGGEIATLEAALQEHAMVAGNRRAQLVVVTDASAVTAGDLATTPTVGVVLSAGSTTALDPRVISAVERFQNHLVPVLPVCTSLRRAQLQLPERLRSINAREWRSGGSAAPVANIVLRLLGLSEEDRRIFLSHRRTDGSALAEQLRHALADDRWDVFLDRFSVPPAVDFQARLDRELADKAFVLLLETPGAASSPWVEHEIAFALRHRLGLSSLALPRTEPSALFPALHDSWRLRLLNSDIASTPAGETLQLAALERVLNRIELAHASASRLRRESLMLDASAELHGQGYTVSTIGEWSLLGRRGAQQEVVLVTARAPLPRDLRDADTLRQRYRRSGVSTRGWVVHPTEDIDRDRAELMRWLSAKRAVSPTPMMLLRSRMGV